VLELIVRHQQSPETACAYLGTDPEEIRGDLEELDQHWLETVRVAVAEDGRILGAAVIEWDADLDRSWVHGPWVEAEAWREQGPALLAAVTEQAPVAHHEMYADLAHEGMAWLADRCGWQAGEGNVELARTAPAPTGALDPGLRLAGDADEAAVRELHEREFPGTYADAAELLDPGSRYSTWVLAPEGEVLGYVAFQRQEESTAYVDFLAVHPEARRSGIGQRLIDGAHQVSGRERVALTVDEHRPGARAFYQSLGFEVAAETRPYRLRRSGA
jgi:ribosomal protein S18 acetylase RimI-like enzyme